MVDLPTVFVSVLSSSAVGGLISFLVKRRADRKDADEGRRVAGLDAVFEAIALLRSSATHVGQNFDGGTPGPEFGPIWESIKKTKDIIETKRLATGPVFADTALALVIRWDYEMTLLIQGRYEVVPTKPDLKELDRRLYEAIPLELKKRIAPGTLADSEKAEKDAALNRATKKKLDDAILKAGGTSATITLETTESAPPAKNAR